MNRLKRNHRIVIVSILFGVLVMLMSGYVPHGAIVSPLAVERPTLPGELIPESYVPAVMLDYSPLPTPTVRPTP